jgi:hypothetical protein
MRIALPALLVLSLVACSASQLASTQTTVDSTVTKAQLYCGLATAAGPLTVALVSAADPKAAPVAVTTADAVKYACGLVQGIPVSPPPAGVIAPTVAVPGALPTVPAG